MVIGDPYRQLLFVAATRSSLQTGRASCGRDDGCNLQEYAQFAEDWQSEPGKVHHGSCSAMLDLAGSAFPARCAQARTGRLLRPGMSPQPSTQESARTRGKAGFLPVFNLFLDRSTSRMPNSSAWKVSCTWLAGGLSVRAVGRVSADQNARVSTLGDTFDSRAARLNSFDARIFKGKCRLLQPRVHLARSARNGETQAPVPSTLRRWTRNHYGSLRAAAKSLKAE